jgi:hypothetical protein
MKRALDEILIRGTGPVPQKQPACDRRLRVTKLCRHFPDSVASCQDGGVTAMHGRMSCQLTVMVRRLTKMARTIQTQHNMGCISIRPLPQLQQSMPSPPQAAWQAYDRLTQRTTNLAGL